MEVKDITSERAKRWERDYMESNLNKWMPTEEVVIDEITNSGSHFIVMKFPFQQIISESAIYSTLNVVSAKLLDIIGKQPNGDVIYDFQPFHPLRRPPRRSAKASTADYS